MRVPGLLAGLMCVLAGFAGTTSFVQAQPERPGRLNLREIIRDLDANTDGVVEPSEVPQKARTQFQTLLKHGDANHDGKLQIDEIRGLLLKMTRGFAPEGLAKAKDLMAQDKDNDGKVSRREFTGPAQMFGMFDANRDGFINADEAAALDKDASPTPAKDKTTDQAKPQTSPLTARPNAKKAAAKKADARPGNGNGERFLQLDRNNDGKVSAEEFPGNPMMFQRLDADKDGFVTREEIQKFGPMNQPGAQNGMRERMIKMDKNGDGKVDKTEFDGPEQLFERLDVNKDGVLSPLDRPKP